MTAGATFDSIRRFAPKPKALLPIVAVGISCFTITVLAQDVTTTNPETSANNSSSLPAGWSEPPPLNEPAPPTEPPPDEIDFPLPASQDNSVVTVTTRNDGYVSAVPRKFHYLAHVNVRGVYDDNIFLTRDHHVGDYYLTIEPGITLGFGDIENADQNYIRLDYAPGAIFYVDHSGANSLQHVIRLQGQYQFPRLSITLRQDVELLEGSNLNSLSSTGRNPVPDVRLDTGGDIATNIYTTNGTFAYDLTGKTFLSGGIQYSVRDYHRSLIGSERLSGNLLINYKYGPKLVIGLGGTVGYDWVDSNPNQLYEQINARISYEPSGKVSIEASGGIEFRQFEGSSSSGAHVSPVYELEVNYQPFDGTTLTLSGSGRTRNSAVLTGQNYVQTSIAISGRQRILQRIYVALAVGYENLSYFRTLDGGDAGREDKYFFVQPAIDLMLTRYCTLGVYYLHRQDDTIPIFEFNDNQFGLRTSITF